MANNKFTCVCKLYMNITKCLVHYIVLGVYSQIGNIHCTMYIEIYLTIKKLESNIRRCEINKEHLCVLYIHFRTVLRMCLAINPKDRPTPEKVYETLQVMNFYLLFSFFF